MSARHTKERSAGNSLRHRIAGTALAAATAAAAVAGGMAVSTDAPTAEAAGGNVVVFGDSLTANPDLYNYLAGKGLPLPNPVLSGSGCGTDNRFSDAVRDGSQLPTDNYSCAGASYRTGGMHIIDQINVARDRGALTPETRQVVLFAGTNDTYPYVLNDHMPVPQIRENLRASISDAARAAREAAPSAKIKIVGMPQVSNGAGEVCPVNVVPNLPMSLPFVQIGEIETALEDAGRAAASDTDSTWVSLKQVSRGHEMCSNDRWVTGLIDTTSERRNLPLHMTDTGLRTIGNYVGEFK